MFRAILSIIVFALTALSIVIVEERSLFDTRALVQIDPIPETERLIGEKRYADADEYLSYFMHFDYVKDNSKAIELDRFLKEKRGSLEYRGEKILEGIFEGKSDEDIGKISAIVSDFLIIGDIRDLVIEGSNYINDRDVDKIIVALSTLGVLSTASTIYSF
ncbi:MAG: hypothetical protein GXO06_05555 [Epsilonproteobacteria bacterium]|nr:hypothetical protein [Campylobacterota bacterium]